MTTATRSKTALPQHRTVMLVLSRLEKIPKCKIITEEFAPPIKKIPTFTIKISQQGVPHQSSPKEIFYFRSEEISLHLMKEKPLPDAHRCSVVKPPHLKECQTNL